MMKTTTPNMAVRLKGGWRNNLGNDPSRRFAPLGLILMFFALFVPNIASAEIVTDAYYDFTPSGTSDTEVTYGTTNSTYSDCTNFTKIGSVADPTRFACQGGNWILKSGGGVRQKGLLNLNNGNRKFLINNLQKGSIVTFTLEHRDNNDYKEITLVSNNATKEGNKVTMTAAGLLAVNIPNYTNILTITIQHDDAAVWGYDPAIETYDIYYVQTQDIQSNNLTPADFPLDYDDLPAQYLTNLQGGMALNKRIAISQVRYQGNITTPWTLQNYGGLKSLYNWHNFAICNLMEGDRVVIQIWTGSAKFSSKAENMAYNGCSAFLDVENNGDFDTGDDTEITCGMDVQNLATYVITEDGHLDIALSADAIFCKVYIYGDHQARMVDDLDSSPANGLKSYFDRTGQLETKHHIVPGGLHVYVGNQNEAHHAEVVSSDEGPVSFVYDDKHFKTPNLTNNSFRLWYDLPDEGTFYRFVPEVDGKITVRFKANSVNYRDWYNHEGNEAIDQAGTPNETNPNVNCPYYFMNGFDPKYPALKETSKGNGATVIFEDVEVSAGKQYYLFGWWDDANNYTQFNNHACGVAELIDVTFKPDQFVYPLAKWVESGATADKLSDLADVQGYDANDVFIKKKSENIESCSAAIVNGKLKITNIKYKAGTNPGGVVLIKVGNRNDDSDPVFALTIAYDASYNPSVVGTDINGVNITRSEGHVWNFSDKPLKALKWNNKDAEADVIDFGTRFNNFATATKDANGIPTNGVTSGNSNDQNYSFLSEEINKGDWTFNYRVKKNGTFHDPRFLNNWDMEGDNADMMWDTEGIIIKAGSTQSCIFNEHGVEIDHTNKTQADPDRYVGFLPGGSFIIPKLKKDDRVVVYMGSGEGSGSESMEFSITNARDAMYNVIDPDDSYHAGGSMWNVPDGHNDPYYRGCYHFFALDDGDMEFKMIGGTMCKLYEIRIYRGARYNTNGIQENGKGYTIFAEKDHGVLTSASTEEARTNTWNLHYRGKGERIADSSNGDGYGKFNQKNEVLTNTDGIQNLNLVRLDNGQGISYTNNGEIGMIRARVKCMEFNNNYVTDFADRNFTLALHDTQYYPYTWDFTDVDLYSDEDVAKEYSNCNEITDLSTITATDDEEKTWYEPLGRELSMWDKNGNMIIYGPNSTDQTLYYNNQNMIFENSKGINGNQLWSVDKTNNKVKVLPETQGLWWYFDNNDPVYDGSMQITEEGLKLANIKKLTETGAQANMGWWNYKMVVPSVPNNHVVYLRMTRDYDVKDNDWSKKTDEAPVLFLNTKFNWGTDEKTDLTPSSETLTAQSTSAEATYNTKTSGNDYVFYNVKDANGQATNDWVIAVKNTKGAASNLTFTLNGWILKKMSISEDKKTLDSHGWATESREHVVDPSLTAFLTGYDIETCFVTEIKYNEKQPTKGGQLTLVRANFEDSKSGDIVQASANGDKGGCILHYTENKPLSILDGGFHLFVPDMHDYQKDYKTKGYADNNVIGIKTNTANPESEIYGMNLLVSQVTDGWIAPTATVDGTSVTNYILSNHYYVKDEGDLTGDTEAFYRVSPTKNGGQGAHSYGHNAFLQLETSKITNQSANGFILTFGDGGDADGINEVFGTNENTDNSIYTIDGKKLETMPTRSGVYIINGKKVVIR